MPSVITPDSREIDSFFNEESANSIDEASTTQLPSNIVREPESLWTNGRNMDFLIPQISSVPNADAKAPLSFSNMFGMKAPEQITLAPIFMSSAVPFRPNSGLKINPFVETRSDNFKVINFRFIFRVPRS